MSSKEHADRLDRVVSVLATLNQNELTTALTMAQKLKASGASSCACDLLAKYAEDHGLNLEPLIKEFKED